MPRLTAADRVADDLEFDLDQLTAEYLALRAVQNGDVDPPPGETAEDRSARQDRLGLLYRYLRAYEALPRTMSTAEGFASRRQFGVHFLGIS